MEAASVTFSQAAVGFLLGGIIGYSLAVVMSISRTAERIAFPYLIISQMIPVLGLAPIIFNLVRDMDASRILIAAYITFFPVAANTLSGFRSVEIEKRQLLYSYAAGKITTYAKLMVPFSIPYLFAGLKIAAPLSVTASILVDMLGSKNGIGVKLLYALYGGNMDIFWASVATSAPDGNRELSRDRGSREALGPLESSATNRTSEGVMSDRWKNVLWPTAFGAAFLLVWQLGWFHALLGLAPFSAPPSFGDRRHSDQEFFQSDGRWGDHGFGSLGGNADWFVVGLWCCSDRDDVSPVGPYGGLIVVSALNAIPIVALSPIMNRWFSDGMAQKIGVVTIVTMAAMAINAYRGLNDLRPYSLDLMKSYAAKRRTIFFQLRLPNALPSVFTALKINITTALIAAIVSEYFASSTAGLGFGIKDNLRKAEMAMGWAYITVASVAGVVLYLLIVFLERRATRWHASQRPSPTN